jgi:hypothetical protein
MMKPILRLRIGPGGKPREMLGSWSLAMVADDEHLRGLRLPNTLDVPARHIALVVGHLLRRVYADLLPDDQPGHLQPLIAKLDATTAEAARRRWR